MHYIDPKGKFMLSPEEKRQGPRFNVSHETQASEYQQFSRNRITRSPLIQFFFWNWVYFPIRRHGGRELNTDTVRLTM